MTVGLLIIGGTFLAVLLMLGRPDQPVTHRADVNDKQGEDD